MGRAESVLSVGFCSPRTCPAALPARRGYAGAGGSQPGAARPARCSGSLPGALAWPGAH